MRDDTFLCLILVTKGGFICRSKMLEIFVISLEDPSVVSNFSFIFILYIRQESQWRQKRVISTVNGLK